MEKSPRRSEVKLLEQHQPAHMNLGTMWGPDAVRFLPPPFCLSFSLTLSPSLSFFTEAKIQPTDNLNEAASGNFSRRQRHLRFHSRRRVAILPGRQILTHIKITLAPTNLQKQTNNSMHM